MRFLLLILVISLSQVAASDKPNIVFILTDNHGAWTMGCYGNPDIQTPHVDALAKRGTRFVNAFANNAVCSPTRATYLTGLMPSQHGVHNFLGGGTSGPQVGPNARNTLAEFTSLPEILKGEGYACGLVGKWHLGNNTQSNEGLDDYWITMPYGGTSTFHGATIIENGELRKEDEYLTTFWTDHALKFIEQEKEAPFFLYLAYNGPYGLSRYQLKPSGNRWEEFYRKKELPSFPRGVIHPWQFNNREYFGNPTSIRRYAEELSAVDDGVGAVVEKLKAEGLLENTIIVFAADQGWTGGQHGLWGMGDHTRPVNAREGSMRIPMVFAGPGIAEDNEPEEFVSNYDFLPGVLGLLGLQEKWPEREQSPGRDFSPLLRGQTVADWQDEVFYEYESLRCIRGEKWKYVERYGDEIDELYAIDTDPGETDNLLLGDAPATVLAEQKAKLATFFENNSTPKYDLWNGGESQSKLLVWGEEAIVRMEGWRERAGIDPIAVDPNFNPPPFTLPDGLIAEVAAAPPLVEHPIMAAFDDRGRLFVAENAGLNLNKEELAAQKPNSIRVLTDTGGDGLFDQSQVFVDGLTFPQGALWLDGSLYVMSPPSLWKFTDTDDDGVADERVEVVTGFDYTGNAADVHGPYLHPGGRLYWCHGRKGHDVSDPITGELVSRAKGARIWSCWPNGSGLEVFAGGGMDNPVEVDFTDTGEIIGSVNLFYGRPRGDTLVHWIRGGVYPRYDQETVIDEFTKTGPLLTEMHNFGHVAVSGMMRYRSGALNPGWKNNLMVTHFNTQEVTRTAFASHGSTYAAKETESILKIGNPDVHVTDVLEDANGDLLVLDTGGWFRIGCPNSQIAKPDIPGAIYRIRKAGAIDRKRDFRGTEIDWESLSEHETSEFLDDERFVVRDAAIAQLASRGGAAISPAIRILQSSDSTPLAKQNAIWALARTRQTAAVESISLGLEATEAIVRQTAANALAGIGNVDLSNSLNDADPAVSRIAATTVRQVQPLLEVAGLESLDRFHRHAIVYSLIQSEEVETLRNSLGTGEPQGVVAAWRSLDQIGEGNLKPGDVLDSLDSESELVRVVAIELATTHPDWAAEIASQIQTWPKTEQQRSPLAELLPSLVHLPPIQQVVARLIHSKEPVGYHSISESEHEFDFPDAWNESFLRDLEDDAALDALVNVRPKPLPAAFSEKLTALAEDEESPTAKRVRALRILGDSTEVLSANAFDLLISLIQPNSQSVDRLTAAQMLVTAKLTRAQQLSVAERVQYAGPVDLPIFWKRLEHTRDEEIGGALAENLPKSPGFGSLHPSDLRRTFNRLPSEVIERIEPHITELEARAAEKDERLTALIAKADRGDPALGKKHFAAGKGACMTCHQIGDTGRAIGPNLSTIGKIRMERDLLESILYPSESIARDFDTFSITKTDDSILVGMIQRETRDTLYFTAPTGEVTPIPRSTVKTVERITTSIMPPGLDQAMTEAELLDLVAYLKSLD